MPTQVETKKNRGTLYTVLADGKFHTEVSPEAPGAIRREFETSDKKKGVKYEHVANSITGHIIEISLFESNFGKQIIISLGDGTVPDVSVYLSTQTQFGEDFMKKLPNINPDKNITLTPYSFEDEKTGKPRKGLTIYQNDGMEDRKIPDYYKRKEEGTDRIVSVNGYPEIPAEAENWQTDDWKLFYLQARKFLLEQVQKSPLYNRMVKNNPMKQSDASTVDYPQEEINPDDIPF